MTTAAITQGSWTKWDEQWSVLIPLEQEVCSGDTVEVVKRDGTAKEVTVEDALGSNDYGTVWSIAKPKAPEVAIGYYAADGTIYKVRPTKDGERRYAMSLMVTEGRGKWTYEQGALGLIRKVGESLTIEEAAQFGHLHGCCAICGATLTNPDSVQRGIGPVCATKIGG